MKIIDAIRGATADDAVYFLLTSYLESFWAREQTEQLSETLLRLPLSGKADVIRRSDLLEAHGAPECTIVAEARDIFRAARERLQCDAEPPAGIKVIQQAEAAVNGLRA